MKKFFSLLAAVLFAGSMMATEVTFTKADFAGQGTANTGSEVSATKDGVTFTFSKGYCADESLRCYAHGALSITAEATIEKINFTTTGGKTGGLEAEVTVGATTYSVADLPSQARFTEIKVTLAGGGDVPPTPADTYTVAGSDAAIFGEAWNPALAANDMTLADGVYTWAKAQLNLTAGTEIQFKVVKNHSWDIAYPAQNYVLNIAEDGEYTLTITFDPTTETVAAEAVKKVIPQYEVAEAIAAGLAENDEILVRGVITKMEFKGKNFAKYGSVNIYVADATGAEGAFEFYNCYSLNADTFRTSDPAYDAESTAWAEFDEVADENGNAIHVGDTVIAFGKYKLYSGTHELNTGCYLTEIKHPGDAPVEEDSVIYDWAGEIGTTILGASGVEVSTVKIHTNTDAVPAIKFGSSYVYADGKWIAIKPAEGGFKAGDVLSVAAVFNNADDTKYAQIDLRAANGDTRIWLSDSASTINGRTSAAEPIVQTYTLEADQDSLFLGRYGNTGMFVTLLKVVREGGDVPPTPEDTWTVAGEPTTAFGSSWTPSDANNDMVKQEDGTYKWERTGLELGAGTVKFKVCKNHDWTESYPAQNYELTIDEAGIYTITITFDPANDNAVNAVATKTGEAVVVPTVVMHGQFASNDWADTEAFAKSEDKKTATLKLTLEAKTIEFGMKFDGSWKANGANITREAASTSLAEGSGNMHLVADVAGEYTFTYTYETQVLAVTYPDAPAAIEVTLSSITTPGSLIWTDAVAEEGWWQIMGANEACDFSLSNAGAIAEAAGTYTIDDLDATYSYINIYGENDTTKVAFVDGSVTVAISEEGIVTVNGTLVGSDGNNYIFNLTYKDPVAENTVNVAIPEWELIDYYVASNGLFVVSGVEQTSAYVQLSLWMPQGATEIYGDYTEEDFDLQNFGCYVADANGAYRIFSATINVAKAENGRVLVTADLLCYNNTLYKVTTTIGEGINAVEAAQKAVKMIQNGQVEIIKNGVHYNINGAVIR